MWPIQMLYAASLARSKGWTTRVLDLHVEPLTEPELPRALLSFGPELVVLDTTTPTMGLARRLARSLRQERPGLPIWAVGQQASALPESFADDELFSGCIRGEYELALMDVLDGKVTSVRGSSPGSGVEAAGEEIPIHITPLESLPRLEPEGISIGAYRLRSMHVRSRGRQRWGFHLTSRGCPYNCIFCSPTLRQSHGRIFRAMPGEALAEDLARLSEAHGITAFYLLDDLFTQDRGRVMDLCAARRRSASLVPFFIQTRADLLDSEMLSELRSAGCAGVKIGVESGSDRILAVLRKGATRDSLLKGARAVRRAGLTLTACYMLGNPTETREEIRETFRLAQEIDADMIQVAFHTPYPGSESYRRYGSQIQDPARLSHYDGDPLSVSLVPPTQLRWEQRLFYARYYGFPSGMWRYLTRRAPYRLTDPDEWRLWWEVVRLWLRWPGGTAP
jgi:radical SAM superfamily enzyme YgiQ (UPF0313 family)